MMERLVDPLKVARALYRVRPALGTNGAVSHQLLTWRFTVLQIAKTLDLSVAEVKEFAAAAGYLESLQ